MSRCGILLYFNTTKCEYGFVLPKLSPKKERILGINTFGLMLTKEDMEWCGQGLKWTKKNVDDNSCGHEKKGIVIDSC